MIGLDTPTEEPANESSIARNHGVNERLFGPKHSQLQCAMFIQSRFQTKIRPTPKNESTVTPVPQVSIAEPTIS